MSAKSPTSGRAGKEPLAILGQGLRDPKFRAAFLTNYQSALETMGIAVSEVPTATLATLRGMSEIELKAVANLNISLDVDGIDERLKSQMV